jgi:hypothetical protein
VPVTWRRCCIVRRKAIRSSCSRCSSI